jgi:hypothetical protein
MKDLVFWAWLTGLGLIMAGLITHLVLDARADGTGEKPAPAGCFITIVGVLVVIVMLCVPASYQPL